MSTKWALAVCVLAVFTACSGVGQDQEVRADPAAMYGIGLCENLATFSVIDAEIGSRLESGRASQLANGMARWRYEAASARIGLRSIEHPEAHDAFQVLEFVDLARVGRERPSEYRDAAAALIEIADRTCQLSFENGVDGDESILVFLARLDVVDVAPPCSCDNDVKNRRTPAE